MDRDPILKRLRESGAEIAAHANATEEVLEKTYGEGNWTIRQVLAHLADVEMINAFRFLRAAAEPGEGVDVFDQNVWANKLNYGSRPGIISGNLFSASRELVIHHLATLCDERLGGASRHPEKGPMTCWEWAELIDGHGSHHLTQLNAARDGVIWTPPAEDNDDWKYLGKAASNDS